MSFIQIGGKNLEKSVILEVKNLKKYFQTKNGMFSRKTYTKAVDGVSLKISKGESLGIVGESGCGKSTLGRTILNLINPTEGEIYFNGEIIYSSLKNFKLSDYSMRSLRKDMQIIFQDPYSSLDPKKTVEQIIGEGLKKHNIVSNDKVKNEIEKLLNQCGLDKSYINKYPFELSGGQRQRVGIARALALKPKFIICDEPTAALDVSVQSQILNLMLDLKEKQGLTYMFISHNLEVVKFFCNRIAVMYLGNIVEIGSSEDIYNMPLHPYTKSLISSIPKTHPLEEKDIEKLEGNIFSSTEDINRCKLYSRCPYKTDRCTVESPKLKEVESRHYVACWNLDL